jgi:hypothetical protein
MGIVILGFVIFIVWGLIAVSLEEKQEILNNMTDEQKINRNKKDAESVAKFQKRMNTLGNVIIWSLITGIAVFVCINLSVLV